MAERRRWWEEYPERYDSELSELERAGTRYEIDQEALAAGFVRLLVYPVVSGTELPLVATFPDLYPYFRFEVEAHAVALRHHQHAFAKTLCLLPRDTKWWRPGSDRLALFLKERLAIVLESGAGNGAAAHDQEDPQGEPFTDYYSYQQDAVVLIDGASTIPSDATSGLLVIGVATLENGARPSQLLRGALLEVRDDRGAILAKAAPEIADRFSHTLEGRWVRLDKPIETDDAKAVFAELVDHDRYSSPIKRNGAQGGAAMFVRAGIFPEEHQWRGIQNSRKGDGWLFAVAVESKQSKGALVPRGRRGRRMATQQPGRVYYLARASRYGRSDLAERAPELEPLANEGIAIFGLGCTGAPSAMEFARAGTGELRLLDSDFVDAATTLRWPFGVGAAGMQKAFVIQQVIRNDYPYTKVKALSARLGSVAAGKADENAILGQMIDGISLVYDATAEAGVQYFLASIASEREIPYLAVWGTEGGWGGAVVRLRPGRTEGCWMCLQHAFASGAIPGPLADESSGRLQPRGCPDPTFTGANFDLAQVAMTGVRLAIATLSAGQPVPAYPDFDWDVGILSLRDASGQCIAPAWRTYPLPRHPDCPVCAAKALTG